MSISDTLTRVLVRQPIDWAIAKGAMRLNTPAGYLMAGGTAAVVGVAQANRMNQDGVGLQSVATVGLGAASGAYMIGIGKAYNKPYFSTMGRTMVAATLVGAGLGAVLHKMQLIPEVHIDIRFGDKAPA